MLTCRFAPSRPVRFLFSFVFIILAATMCHAQGWKAGTARICITPDLPMPMAGFALRGSKHAEGTLTDLWAKALVLEDSNGNQAVLVTLDLLGIDRVLSDAVCQQIQKEQGWERRQIVICASHNHSGPVCKEVLSPAQKLRISEENQLLIQNYVTSLKPRIVQVVRDAVKQLEPAELSSGSGHSKVAVNRRENKPSKVLELRAEGKLKGPSDYDVPVLLIRQQGKPTAILFGYACHNTVLSSMQWSGDYSGFAQLNLEEMYPNCEALFWAGCGGDQDPMPRGTVERAQEYGKDLALAVQKVIDGPMTPVTPTLATSYELIDLPFGKVPTTEELEKTAKSSNAQAASHAKGLLLQIQNGQPLKQTYPYPVAVWKLGTEVSFIFMGGETVVDYAIRLKEELKEDSPHQQIWCAGYSNEVMGYIPSKRVLLEGGYEGGEAAIYSGLPAVWDVSVEETIVNAVRRLMKQQ